MPSSTKSVKQPVRNREDLKKKTSSAFFVSSVIAGIVFAPFFSFVVCWFAPPGLLFGDVFGIVTLIIFILLQAMFAKKFL